MGDRSGISLLLDIMYLDKEYDYTDNISKIIEYINKAKENPTDESINYIYENKSPIMLAIINDHKELIQPLIEAGAILTQKLDTGEIFNGIIQIKNKYPDIYKWYQTYVHDSIKKKHEQKRIETKLKLNSFRSATNLKERRLAHTFEPSATGVKAYWLLGHGNENGTRRFIVPKNCMIVAKAQFGESTLVSAGHRQKLTKLSDEINTSHTMIEYDEKDPSEKLKINTYGKDWVKIWQKGNITEQMIKDPINNKKELYARFGTVAVYGPGDECPFFNYSLASCYPSTNIDKCADFGSGVRDIESKMTDTEIMTKFDSIKDTKEDIIEYIANLYSNSVYPTRTIIIENLNKLYDSKQNEINATTSVTEKIKFLFDNLDHILYISQESLCKLFPGIYYNFICRYDTKEFEKSMLTLDENSQSYKLNLNKSGNSLHFNAYNLKQATQNNTKKRRSVKNILLNRIGEAAVHRASVIREGQNTLYKGPAINIAKIRNERKAEDLKRIEKINEDFNNLLKYFSDPEKSVSSTRYHIDKFIIDILNKFSSKYDATALYINNTILPKYKNIIVAQIEDQINKKILEDRKYLELINYNLNELNRIIKDTEKYINTLISENTYGYLYEVNPDDVYTPFFSHEINDIINRTATVFLTELKNKRSDNYPLPKMIFNEESGKFHPSISRKSRKVNKRKSRKNRR
jgi:hypothetical protein